MGAVGRKVSEVGQKGRVLLPSCQRGGILGGLEED